MSLNVYLTFFHRYSGNQLYALERYYIAINYGVPFVPAVIYLLIEGNDRGPMYGDATVSYSLPDLYSSRSKDVTFTHSSNSFTSSGAGSQSDGTSFVLPLSTALSGEFWTYFVVHFVHTFLFLTFPMCPHSRQ